MRRRSSQPRGRCLRRSRRSPLRSAGLQAIASTRVAGRASAAPDAAPDAISRQVKLHTPTRPDAARNQPPGLIAADCSQPPGQASHPGKMKQAFDAARHARTGALPGAGKGRGWGGRAGGRGGGHLHPLPVAGPVAVQREHTRVLRAVAHVDLHTYSQRARLRFSEAAQTAPGAMALSTSTRVTRRVRMPCVACLGLACTGNARVGRVSETRFGNAPGA